MRATGTANADDSRGDRSRRSLIREGRRKNQPLHRRRRSSRLRQRSTTLRTKNMARIEHTAWRTRRARFRTNHLHRGSLDRHRFCNTLCACRQGDHRCRHPRISAVRLGKTRDSCFFSNLFGVANLISEYYRVGVHGVVFAGGQRRKVGVFMIRVQNARLVPQKGPMVPR